MRNITALSKVGLNPIGPTAPNRAPRLDVFLQTLRINILRRKTLSESYETKPNNTGKRKKIKRKIRLRNFLQNLSISKQFGEFVEFFMNSSEPSCNILANLKKKIEKKIFENIF